MSKRYFTPTPTAIVWPLFMGRGTILTLDNVAGIANTASALQQKIFVVTTVFIGLASLAIQQRNFSIVSLLGSMFFWVTSPFFSERLAIGQWHLLLSLAFLPWLFYFFSTPIKPIKIMLGLLSLYFMLTLYPRSFSFLEVLIIAMILAYIPLNKRTVATYSVSVFFKISFIICTTQIFRFVGFTFGGDRLNQVSDQQLPLFSSGNGNTFDILLQSFSYIGFWAERAHRLPIDLSSTLIWSLPGVIFLIVSGIGWVQIRKRSPSYAIFLLATYSVSLLIVLSNTQNGIDPRIIATLYDYFGLTGLREAGKFMTLMLAAQTIAVGVGVKYLFDIKSFYAKVLLVLASIGITLYLPVLFTLSRWGLFPTKIPDSLLRVSQESNRNNTKVIIVPWHRFQSYPFTNGKIIDQIAPALFKNTVFNEMFEYNGILTTSADPWQQNMARITTLDQISDEFTTLLKEKDISTIIIAKTNDYQKYVNWAKTNNLKLVNSDENIVTYQFSN